MFNTYPYTDFHELNLDWFLNQFKELVSDWEAFKTDLTAQWEQVSTDWETLYNYVHDYFDNLDVQTEIDNKLDSMVADGTLLAVIQPTVVTTTSGWLADHITNPSNPPIDTSLSISGAAADAKIVGDDLKYLNDIFGTGFRLLNGAFPDAAGIITAGAQYDTFCFRVTPDTVIKTITSSAIIIYAFYANEPQNGSVSVDGSRVVTTSTMVTDVAVPSSANWIAIRVLAGGVANIDPNSFIVSTFIGAKDSYSGNDINNIKENSWYYIDSSKTNSPFYGVSACMLETVEADTGAFIQIAHGFSGQNKGVIYTRTYINNAWTDWVIMKPVNVKLSYSGNDINDIKENSWYYIAQSKLNSPFYGTSACMLETVEAVTGAYIQMAHGFSGQNKGVIYTRTYLNNAWSDWVINTPQIYNTLPEYHAFGDSITWGAKWVSSDTAPYYTIVRTAIENRIPTRIGNAIKSISINDHAVSGASLANGDIITTIRNTDLTNAKLITIQGGRNDSGATLGTPQSTAGDGTICGAYKEIIEYLITNCPMAQIVIIGVTPHSSDNSTIWTNTFSGGWSINDFNTQVGALCEQYNTPYVDWKKCSIMNKWADYTSVAGNYVHPDNDIMYLQMGNYIAGQISNYYIG